jgi:hypothetical protein
MEMLEELIEQQAPESYQYSLRQEAIRSNWILRLEDLFCFYQSQG